MRFAHVTTAIMAGEIVKAHREFRLLAMTYAGRIAAVKVGGG
jgi:hypothetical protein